MLQEPLEMIFDGEVDSVGDFDVGLLSPTSDHIIPSNQGHSSTPRASSPRRPIHHPSPKRSSQEEPNEKGKKKKRKVGDGEISELLTTAINTLEKVSTPQVIAEVEKKQHSLFGE